MFSQEDAVFCDGCGTEIRWAPVIVMRRHYCCSECAEGRTCACDKQAAWEDERRSTHAFGVEA